MMNFDEFMIFVTDHFPELWPEEEKPEIRICQVLKNNGQKFYNLQIRQRDTQISPVLNMERYYIDYWDGMDRKDILLKIYRDYRAGMKKAVSITPLPMDFDKINSQIIFRLVNWQKNKEQLEDAPHVRLGDLAMTFLWLQANCEDHIATSLITHSILDIWDMDQEELLRLALVNTQRLFPPKIRSMEDMLKDLTGSDWPAEACQVPARPQIYVLTNQSGINGASAILYKGLLEEVSEKAGQDLYIIPSSIHEVLLVPTEGFMDADSIRKMIREVNLIAVSPGDYLSDSLYYYERDGKQIRMAD